MAVLFIRMIGSSAYDERRHQQFIVLTQPWRRTTPFAGQLHSHQCQSKLHRMPPHVDVVVVFRAASKRTPLSKEQTRKNAARTERQYTALIGTLTRAGLKAVGRRGENQDQLLVLVTCPPDLLVRLVHCERSVVLWLCGMHAG